MSAKTLAEAIMLQTMEDLWDKNERADAVRFFDGEGFGVCAKIAGLNFFEQLRLYNMANKMIAREMPEKKRDKKLLVPAGVAA
ncbi:MAG: hypothetical protein EPN94_11395 [Nitrospirae bacterium]|nr:MAG: hypothetical protein EPN94_11395 [Nitrospirota bacterium]